MATIFFLLSRIFVCTLKVKKSRLPQTEVFIFPTAVKQSKLRCFSVDALRTPETWTIFSSRGDQGIHSTRQLSKHWSSTVSQTTSRMRTLSQRIQWLLVSLKRWVLFHTTLKMKPEESDTCHLWCVSVSCSPLPLSVLLLSLFLTIIPVVARAPLQLPNAQGYQQGLVCKIFYWHKVRARPLCSKKCGVSLREAGCTEATVRSAVSLVSKRNNRQVVVRFLMTTYWYDRGTS